MSELPDGWVLTTLETITILPKQDIVDGPFGSNLKASEYRDTGVPIIRLQNIERNEFIDKNIKFISPEKAELLQRHSFLSGDIIVTKLGKPLGKACIVPDTLSQGIIVADVVRIRSNDAFYSSKYLIHAVNSQTVISQLVNEVKGTTRPRVNLSHIRQLKIPFAPLNEQRRIVAKLEKLLAKCEASKQRLDKIPHLLKQFRQSILAAACSGRLTADWRTQHPNTEPASELINQIKETILKTRSKKSQKRQESSVHSISGIEELDIIPESWQLLEIRDICESSFYGPRFGKNEYVDEGIPTIRTTDMTENGDIVLKDPPRINIPDNRLDDFKVVSGDLLVTRTGSIGTMAVFQGDYLAIPSAYLIRFRFSSLMPISFIFYYLRSPIGQQLLGLSSTSVTQPNINAEAIKSLPIPIPPLEEQKEIVKRVEKLFKLADQIEQRYHTAKAFVDKLPQAILAKAFRGELVPQDPDDEPASVLLERIQAERAERDAADKAAKKSKRKSTRGQTATGQKRGQKPKAVPS